LFFSLAALNDLEIKGCNVQNAFVQAKTKEKVWTRGKQEFNLPEGAVVLIVRALHGLKSSGARFRDAMANALHLGGFQSSKADPDIWMCAVVKPDGAKFCEHVLCCVDDIVCQGLHADEFMECLSAVHALKLGSAKVPEMCLGADIHLHELSSGEKAWATSSNTCAKCAVAEVERELNRVRKELKEKVQTPLASDHHLELDATPKLDECRVSCFASLMGVLQWIIELGHVGSWFVIMVPSCTS
jgi:hypothetical protein